MARLKSLIVQFDFDLAIRAHNCQSNARHRIERGEIRLKVKNGRGWDHYCKSCAVAIIEKDIERLVKSKNVQSIEQEFKERGAEEK